MVLIAPAGPTDHEFRVLAFIFLAGSCWNQVVGKVDCRYKLPGLIIKRGLREICGEQILQYLLALATVVQCNLHVYRQSTSEHQL